MAGLTKVIALAQKGGDIVGISTNSINLKCKLMTSHLSFSSQFMLISLFGLLGFILLTIGLFKIYLKTVAKRDLKGTESSRRNKYRAVDIHQFRSSFIGLSLVLTLGLTEDIEIEPPRSSTPPPPPPPPPPPVIQEVPDELVIEEEQMEFVDQSVEAHTEVFRPDPIVEKEAAPPPPPPPPPPPMEEEVAEIFKVVEQMPRFPGCEGLAGNDQEKKACADKKLLEFIYENITYPPTARENSIQGTVVVQFVVEKDGGISSAKVVREIGGGCGDEAMRIIDLMDKMSQKWIPGKQRGRAVRVMFNLPIKFQLKNA